MPVYIEMWLIPSRDVSCYMGMPCLPSHDMLHYIGMERLPSHDMLHYIGMERLPSHDMLHYMGMARLPSHDMLHYKGMACVPSHDMLHYITVHGHGTYSVIVSWHANYVNTEKVKGFVSSVHYTSWTGQHAGGTWTVICLQNYCLYTKDQVFRPLF